MDSAVGAKTIRFLNRTSLIASCLCKHSIPYAAMKNVGSIFGIGFAPWTGGAIQFLNQNGIAKSLQRAEELAAKYGERFTAPKLLRTHAISGDVFK